MILSMRSINYSLIYEEYTSRCAAQGKASQLELTTAVARKQARRLHSRFEAGATVPTGVLWRSNLEPEPQSSASIGAYCLINEAGVDAGVRGGHAGRST